MRWTFGGEYQKHGDPFPLPIARHLHESTQAREISIALNKLAGTQSLNSNQQLPYRIPTVVQSLVVERIQSAIAEAGTYPEDLHPDGALQEMMRSKTCMMGSPAPLLVMIQQNSRF